MTRSILTFVCTFLAIVSVAEDTIPLKSKTTQPKQETAASLQPQPYISSLGVFGSSRVNETMLRQALGKELDTWLGKGLKGDETALQMELELAEKAKKKFDFAVADWTVMQFFEPTDLAIHVTLDVVEKADVSKRMPFKSAPKGEFKDPDGLLSSWRQYEEIALDLVEAGAITPDTEKCPAVHCPFGHSHKKLKPFEKIFSEGVKKNEKVLVEILNQSAQMDDRASAAYLLAYLNEPNKVSSLLIPAIKDSEPLVRNNVLRVLGDIAERNKDVVLPSKPFLEALEFPRSSDRSKAVFVVLMMSSGSQQVREDVLKSSVPALLAMLKGNQPDQRDFSHNILRKVSGKDFPVTDYLAWNNWYQKLSKERALTSGKPKESN
jgi:hypothetical protein